MNIRAFKFLEKMKGQEDEDDSTANRQKSLNTVCEVKTGKFADRKSHTKSISNSAEVSKN